jgi:hypothetical protein
VTVATLLAALNSRRMKRLLPAPSKSNVSPVNGFSSKRIVSVSAGRSETVSESPQRSATDGLAVPLSRVVPSLVSV